MLVGGLINLAKSLLGAIGKEWIAQKQQVVVSCGCPHSKRKIEIKRVGSLRCPMAMKVGKTPVKTPLSRSSCLASCLCSSAAKLSAPLCQFSAQRTKLPQRIATRLCSSAGSQRQPAALMQSGGPSAVSSLTLIRSRLSWGVGARRSVGTRSAIPLVFSWRCAPHCPVRMCSGSDQPEHGAVLKYFRRKFKLFVWRSVVVIDHPCILISQCRTIVSSLWTVPQMVYHTADVKLIQTDVSSTVLKTWK